MSFADYVVEQSIRRYGSISKMTPAQVKRMRKQFNRATKLDRFLDVEL